MVTFRSKLSVCRSPVNPTLPTATLFDVAHVELAQSAIDQYLARLTSINLLAPSPTAFDHLQAQLILLGVVAAVESYFRTLLRRLITLDSECQNCAEDQAVTFGAAMHLSKQMMPEALLERVTFVSETSLVDALRQFVGLKGNLPPDLLATFRDYAVVCQLRHCAVHRFGKLGVKNAIFLGLRAHKPSLEKPLLLTYPALQNAIAISTGVVKTTNNFLFNEVLSRLPAATWTAKWGKDKVAFIPYYRLFADTVSSTKSVPARDVYNLFQDQRSKFSTSVAF
ncbi:MAG: hypothetical protein SH820_14045 [Xanthomonadales bacterium]|nr:hypothetical protein [Xanthomonadales bacterium]